MDGQENGLRSARIVKRHRRDLKGKKIGIMKQTIRRLGRRAGVERISYLSYEAPASTMHKRKYPQDASSLDCKVCFQKMEEKLTFSPKCGHAFCLVCWKGYVKAKIKEGSVRRIACMGDGCNEKLSEGDILNKILAAHGKGLLSGRYKKFKSANLADRNPAKRWCWTPDCNTVLDKKQLKCPTCKKKWSKKAAEEFQKQMEKIAHSLDLPITESLRRCKECDAFIIKKKGTCNKVTMN
ncbi:hypothetical protein AAMO2058_000686800 [Amorphochlora amoebiformis]